MRPQWSPERELLAAMLSRALSDAFSPLDKTDMYERRAIEAAKDSAREWFTDRGLGAGEVTTFDFITDLLFSDGAAVRETIRGMLDGSKEVNVECWRYQRRKVS